jgi:2-phospho-L-lactate/phosphoenolpyruvate guanylyltransferase
MAYFRPGGGVCFKCSPPTRGEVITRMPPVILIPVKDPEQAKLRMAPALTPEERSSLAWAMFQDVARALRSISPPSQIAVVTGSSRAANAARELGWRIFWESEQISESASVDRASNLLAMQGTEAVLRLPADIPLVQPEDIHALLNQTLENGSSILVPSHDFLGTNALIRMPPNLFASRFGHNSLVLHTQEARRVQASFTILENKRIALDLDTPSDILCFMKDASQTESYRLLRDLRIEERLVEHAT